MSLYFGRHHLPAVNETFCRLRIFKLTPSEQENSAKKQGATIQEFLEASEDLSRHTSASREYVNKSLLTCCATMSFHDDPATSHLREHQRANCHYQVRKKVFECRNDVKTLWHRSVSGVELPIKG